MSDETTPTWGYHRSKEPKIHDLKAGESLPKGWADTPAAFDKPEEPEEVPTAEATAEPQVDPVA